MADNQYPQGDATSRALNAEPDFQSGNTPSQLEADARPVFNFDDEVSEAETPDAQRGGGAFALKDKALNRLQAEADSRKGVVSEQLKQVSNALGGIGGQGSETPQWLSNGVGQATQLIDRIADSVENRNSAELVEDVRGFARANPALFLGAFALAGFVAVRVLAAAGDAR